MYHRIAGPRAGCKLRAAAALSWALDAEQLQGQGILPLTPQYTKSSYLLLPVCLPLVQCKT